MTKVRCCEKCFETLAKKSTNAARLWLDICELRARTGGRFFLRQETKETKILEQMRFIVTAEDLYHGHEHVAVGLTGVSLDKDYNFTFCIGKDHA